MQSKLSTCIQNTNASFAIHTSAFEEKFSHLSTFCGLFNFPFLSDFNRKGLSVVSTTSSFPKHSANCSFPFPWIVQAKRKIVGIQVRFRQPTRAPYAAVTTGIIFGIIFRCLELVSAKTCELPCKLWDFFLWKTNKKLSSDC